MQAEDEASGVARLRCEATRRCRKCRVEALSMGNIAMNTKLVSTTAGNERVLTRKRSTS
jgi:hypothetical protein